MQNSTSSNSGNVYRFNQTRSSSRIIKQKESPSTSGGGGGGGGDFEMEIIKQLEDKINTIQNDIIDLKSLRTRIIISFAVALVGGSFALYTYLDDKFDNQNERFDSFYQLMDSKFDTTKETINNNENEIITIRGIQEKMFLSINTMNSKLNDLKIERNELSKK